MKDDNKACSDTTKVYIGPSIVNLKIIEISELDKLFTMMKGCVSCHNCTL